MGRIQIVLKDDTEKGLRKIVNKDGFKKGNLSKYVEDLIKESLKCKSKKQ